MHSRGKKLVEAALKGINEPKQIRSTAPSPNVVEHNQEYDEKLDCSFSGIVPFEGLSSPDHILVSEEACILSQPTNEWREYIINSTDNTLLPICTTENEIIEVIEIIEEERTSIQESNPIKNNGNGQKEEEKYNADAQESNLIENESLEAESNSFEEENSKIEKGVLETTSENNSNRMSLNSSEEHSSSLSDKPVSRISKNRLKAKKKRVLGQSYKGYKKFDSGKIVQNCEKSSRTIKQRCAHINTTKKTSRTFMCILISDDERNLLFKKFWNFPTWAEKKAFVMGLVSTRKIRRRRKRTEENRENTFRKNEGHDIFLPRSNGERVKVCRLFFINTFNLGADTFKRWTKRSESEEIADNEGTTEMNNTDEEQQQTKRRKIEGMKKKTHEEMKENVAKWLKLLPTVPSHYCRSNSSCTYVESTFRSLSHMHNVFEEWCRQNSVKSVSRTFFMDVLKDQNIKIHHPRKDQCDICCGYEVKMITPDIYQKHIEMKNEARDAKIAAKNDANENHLVLTMDLQSVLLCPKTEASAMYYKQKLQLHNFTIFVLNNKDVTLYVWHESNGGVTSNEFTSCLIHFITSQAENFRMVTIISDGCNYQNRNKVLASALSSLASEKNLLIRQLILEKGHTMMECDSVHATLEKYFVPPINSPSDYIAHMRSARPKHPYNIKVLDYSFFQNFEKLTTNIKSLRPGKKSGDPHVTDIRALEYRPDGNIFFKLRHTEPYSMLPQRKIKTNEVQQPTQLYKRPISISESKWKCLQDLKHVIEKDHHSFYDNIPFQPDKKVKTKN